jgi:hypothetical protein
LFGAMLTVGRPCSGCMARLSPRHLERQLFGAA